jgi:hypothetical protein
MATPSTPSTPSKSSPSSLMGNMQMDSSFNSIKKWIVNWCSKSFSGSYRLWQLLFFLSVTGCCFYSILVSSTLSLTEERVSYHIKSDSNKSQLTVVINTFKRHKMMIGKTLLTYFVCFYQLSFTAYRVVG